MSTLRTARRVVAGLLTTFVALALGAGLGATVSSAATRDLGGVMWSATKGNAETLLSIYTEGGCAADAKRVSAVLYGEGLPKNGQVVVAPSTVLFSATKPMALPISNAFVVYAEQNNTALTGTYDLKVRCTDRFGVNALGEFTSTMKWKTPGGSAKNVDRATFTAKNTATVKQSDVSVPDGGIPVPVPSGPAAPTAPAPNASTPPSSAPSTPAESSAPTGSASAAPSTVAPSVDALAGASSTTSGAGNDSTPQILVIAVTFVLLGAFLWWLLRRREDPA